MIRAAKICGGVVAVLLVYSCLWFIAKPQVARSVFYRIENLHFTKLEPVEASGRMDSPPKLFFWAWERPEDLRFLEHKNAGVAFLAKTIVLPAPDQDPHKDEGGSFFIRPRLQPLRVAPSTPLIAVVRIETPAGRQLSAYARISSRALPGAPFTPLQRQGVVDEIVELARRRNIRAIQIDMDAKVSERAFYSELLSELRQKLPAALPLSITALVSWCIGDRWLEGLPAGTVDEAVPMLFRMGPDSTIVAKYLRAREDFPVAVCQFSVGVSTDEPLSNAVLRGEVAGVAPGWRAKRVYVFAPRAWTQSTAEAVLRELQP